jgi:hypothetical protein
MGGKDPKNLREHTWGKLWVRRIRCVATPTTNERVAARRRVRIRVRWRRACFYLDASRVSSPRSSCSMLQKPARNDGDARGDVQSVEDDDVADVVGTSRGGASRAILRRASRIRTIAISARRAAQTSSHRRRALARPARRLSSARRRARRRVPRTRRSRRPGASAHAPSAHDKITRHAQFGLVLEPLQERVKSRVVRADLHVRELVQKRREHAILIHPPHRPSSPRSRAKQQSDPLSSIEVISPQLASAASRGRRRREFGELIHDPPVTTHDAVPTPHHALERDARAPT